MYMRYLGGGVGHREEGVSVETSQAHVQRASRGARARRRESTNGARISGYASNSGDDQMDISDDNGSSSGDNDNDIDNGSVVSYADLPSRDDEPTDTNMEHHSYVCNCETFDRGTNETYREDEDKRARERKDDEDEDEYEDDEEEDEHEDDEDEDEREDDEDEDERDHEREDADADEGEHEGEDEEEREDDEDAEDDEDEDEEDGHVGDDGDDEVADRSARRAHEDEDFHYDYEYEAQGYARL